MDAPRWIVAMGGGGFSMEPDDPRLDDALLDLVRRARQVERPRVCFLATAGGDAEADIEGFHAAFDAKAEATHLALFERTVEAIEPYLLAPLPALRRRTGSAAALSGPGRLRRAPAGVRHRRRRRPGVPGRILHTVVSSRPSAAAYRVEPGPDGTAVETRLETRYLE